MRVAIGARRRPRGSRAARRARRANPVSVFFTFLAKDRTWNLKKGTRRPTFLSRFPRIPPSARDRTWNLGERFSFYPFESLGTDGVVSSAAPEATLTARRRRRTPETHRTMFAVHSFATHSSAAAFRPSLRRYAPRRPPPIARATWPTHSTLASVDGPPRTESPRASRRPPRTRLALSRD